MASEHPERERTITALLTHPVVYTAAATLVVGLVLGLVAGPIVGVLAAMVVLFALPLVIEHYVKPR